ncbi:SulP family inorganic anion transporter [Solwaraspora sp. WMMD937]|uniref:SulP family inorganic anion transporter n=1 Tax=Solwaraspora sp. WMMD937 TaxID=3016090 RepID=UPI00249CBDA7|nr:SulP family inorganic anion transporter [Solwaraspora sp. WMMD937]WFE20431.1 SulP family inorganic anion transporter [Solwaraspora sp. WMMD937]
MSATAVRRLLPQVTDWRAVRRQPGRDLLAGLTVAVVALPLALGFGVASGLGAAAGLVTAVVAGALAAVFGGSNLQVSGPTGAMTVVLVPIVAQFGPGGVLTVGMLAGLILILLALVRAGQVARYMPAPVIEGFTAGIAGVILLQQIPTALGVHVQDERVLALAGQAVAAFVRQPQWPSLLIAAAVAAAMLAGARWRPTAPFALLAVAAATVTAALSGLPVQTIGVLPASLPAPSLAFLDLAAVPALATAAIAVAALAALESLLSATVADGMSVGQRHDPDRELFGQGVANLVTPLFGGVPATAAIARTAANVRAGAASRLAALSHALILALLMFVAAPLVSQIPLAALAGVLIATAIRMVEVSTLAALARASRSDGLVMALTAATTVLLDLVTAVLVGLVVAGGLALRRIAQAVRLDRMPLDTGDHHAEEQALLVEHIVAYRLDGPLFFAAAHRFLLELSDVAEVRVVILRMSRVSTIDASGALVLRDVVQRLERRGITVYLSGIRDGHRKALIAFGLLPRLNGLNRVFPDTAEAIAAARQIIGADR